MPRVVVRAVLCGWAVELYHDNIHVPEQCAPAGATAKDAELFGIQLARQTANRFGECRLERQGEEDVTYRGVRQRRLF